MRACATQAKQIFMHIHSPKMLDLAGALALSIQKVAPHYSVNITSDLLFLGGAVSAMVILQHILANTCSTFKHVALLESDLPRGEALLAQHAWGERKTFFFHIQS